MPPHQLSKDKPTVSKLFSCVNPNSISVSCMINEQHSFGRRWHSQYIGYSEREAIAKAWDDAHDDAVLEFKSYAQFVNQLS